MRRFNPGNFYCGTTAEWTSCPRPVRHPDHMSGSGSDYWYGESGVVRYSDHWGSEVASCDWYLDGVARCSFDDHDGWRCGFAPWTEFELKTFEVTVYHPDLLPSESAAALGDPVRSGVAPAWRPGMADIPYASYRVRPDMIVDGCVVVAGTYGDCGTPFDGRCLMSVEWLIVRPSMLERRAMEREAIERRQNAEHEKWKRYQDERHDWEWERDRTIWKDGNEE